MTQNEFIAKYGNRKEVIIELGCGPYKKDKQNIAIDIYKDDNIDIVHDLNKGLSFIPDNSDDLITSRHVLEHIENIDTLIKEIYRVLKPNGSHHVIVPHFSNPFFYSDLTHKNAFGLYSFDYYAQNSDLKRKVPTFYNSIDFKITKRKLEFRSRFLVFQIFKRLFTRIINISNSTKELYEESFSSLIFCNEIRFEMIKV